MRILLDENLPARLTARLRELGHDVEHVYSLDLSGRPDADVRAIAESQQRTLITQDIRFADARTFVAPHPGMILVRLKHPSLHALTETIASAFATNDTRAWQGRFVVITESKVRVR